jgi:hypothetical protein
MKPYDHAWKERQIGTNGSEDNRWWKEFNKERAAKKNLVSPAEKLSEKLAYLESN